MQWTNQNTTIDVPDGKRGKTWWASYDWFQFWLDKKVAWKTNYSSNRSKRRSNSKPEKIELLSPDTQVKDAL